MRNLVCAENEIKSLKPSDIKNLMGSGNRDQYLLIDVRQPHEYKEGHIPGAILIPLSNLEARHNDLPRDKTIIVYCRSGHRSKAAAITLTRLGFKEIRYLDGGIINWPHEKNRGMPSVKPDETAEIINIQDILVLAIRQEMGSRDFYVAVKNKVLLTETRWIFQMLADVEESHIERLYQYAPALLDDKALLLIEKLKYEPKPELKEEMESEVEILEISLEKEFISCDFFKRASGIVARQNAQTLLYELCMDERNHANILLKQLEKAIAQ